MKFTVFCAHKEIWFLPYSLYIHDHSLTSIRNEWFILEAASQIWPNHLIFSFEKPSSSEGLCTNDFKPSHSFVSIYICFSFFLKSEVEPSFSINDIWEDERSYLLLLKHHMAAETEDYSTTCFQHHFAWVAMMFWHLGKHGSLRVIHIPSHWCYQLKSKYWIIHTQSRTRRGRTRDKEQADKPLGKKKAGVWFTNLCAYNLCLNQSANILTEIMIHL